MAKTFAGARLRRLREERRLSQVDLARVLELSPSYLNQIEHDARPLTVPVLLRLTEAFGVDASFFAARDTARLTAEVREAVADEVESGAVNASEIAELAERMPGMARTLVDLRARLERLSTAVGRRDDAEMRAPTSHEQVRDFFSRHRNHIPVLDEAAERLAGEIGVRAGETRAALVRRLIERHGVRVQVGEQPEGELHRYDADRDVLRLAPHLRPGQRAFRVATVIAQLEFPDLIEAEVADAVELGDPDTRALARIGLAHYAAAALVLPYRAFHGTAERFGYDLERLADHFGVGFETVAHRCSTLQRPSLPGVPFAFVRVDRAGNMSKRQSATAFHFSRGGGTCPLWNVYEAFASPGRVSTQIAEMPDGQRYFWIARTVSRRRGGWHTPTKTFAVGLGCELRHAERLVYSAGLDLADRSVITPIGSGCRTCERLECPQRAFPPLGKSLAVDPDRSTFVPYPVHP
ncbi:short-chain fatty acyl-CoA regulator family protein [Actinomycetospora termitidis]|uniref:Short-chain fatty acyl-CoA regulator family protein n=1 Tax=Actinomycetospora termitidis TaxID=3053470 RepID=A0ABT7M9K3_9PSEU|nr:short-chain fatty acyl-CoA regulator family protein [Actinomycetospora sp. Odt1-22]MDL5156482.1 short-chain fatty acyl-CoA regulator family protein [Actinomycetospora sp. Odt1-22]